MMISPIEQKNIVQASVRAKSKKRAKIKKNTGLEEEENFKLDLLKKDKEKLEFLGSYVDLYA